MAILAPIEAAIITSSHLTPLEAKAPLEAAAETPAEVETPLEELKPEDYMLPVLI